MSKVSRWGFKSNRACVIAMNKAKWAKIEKLQYENEYLMSRLWPWHRENPNMITENCWQNEEFVRLNDRHIIVFDELEQLMDHPPFRYYMDLGWFDNRQGWKGHDYPKSVTTGVWKM